MSTHHVILHLYNKLGNEPGEKKKQNMNSLKNILNTVPGPSRCSTNGYYLTMKDIHLKNLPTHHCLHLL